MHVALGWKRTASMRSPVFPTCFLIRWEVGSVEDAALTYG